MNQKEESELFEKKLVFKNEIFKNDIFENGFNSVGDIEFNNCVFERITSLENIKAQNISFNNCSFKNELRILSCTFFSFIISNSKFLNSSTYISSTCKSSLVLINNSGLSVEISGWYQSVKIASTKLNKLMLKDINAEYSPRETQIEFEEENEIAQLNFESLSNYAKIHFNHGKYDSITFYGTFNSDISFNENISTEYLFFESSILKGRLDLRGGEYEQVNLYRSSFQGLIHINGYNVLENKGTNLSIKEISLHSSHFEKTVSVNLQNLETISLSNNSFEQLFDFNNHLESSQNTDYTFIDISGSNQGNIIVENVYANLSLFDINLGNLYFKNIALHTLYLNEFINKGNVSFTNIISGIYLTIHNSILGSFNLVNEDLNTFEETVIANSNIEGIKLGVYPKKIHSYSSNPKLGYGLKDKTKNSYNLRNIYNQFKQVAKSSGDIDIMYKYKSLELRELIRIKKVGFDSILLILNWVSNNNGRSWVRGVLFTLLIGFVFFLQYIKSIGVDSESFVLYEDYILYLTSFPELSLKKYEEFNKHWNVSLVIWLSRIFVSYGIYQTISAFRKYGRH